MFDLKGSLKPEDFINKVVVWDIDGTLAPLRFNGHLTVDSISSISYTQEELEAGIFRKRKPSKFMQRLSRECVAIKQIVVGHYLFSIEVNDKRAWVKEHFPNISECIFVSTDISKADTIISYCKSCYIDMENVIFVDDIPAILQDAECKGISAWHISSLLDYFEEGDL